MKIRFLQLENAHYKSVTCNNKMYCQQIVARCIHVLTFAVDMVQITDYV